MLVAMDMKDLGAEAVAGDTLAEDISVAIMSAGVIFWVVFLAKGHLLGETMGSPVINGPTNIVKLITDMPGLMASVGIPDTG